MNPNFTTAILDGDDLDGLSVAALSDLADMLAAEEFVLKRRKETLHALNTQRFLPAAISDLARDGKDTGTATFHYPSYTVKVEIGKKVKWHQGALKEALDAMTPENARHYAKVTVEVSEANFKAAPPDIRALLLPARTVETEKPRFTFKLKQEDAA